MNFFNIFGGNPEDNKNNDTNDCHQQLREHLKKCAGFGQRPPVVNSCCTDAPKSDCPEAKDDLGGPPTCQGNTPAPACCPAPVSKKVEQFVPKCEVPPTLTFKCPESSCEVKCEEVKPKCQEVKLICCEPAQPKKQC